jgi:hypothetical protein
VALKRDLEGQDLADASTFLHTTLDAGNGDAKTTTNIRHATIQALRLWLFGNQSASLQNAVQDVRKLFYLDPLI